MSERDKELNDELFRRVKMVLEYIKPSLESNQDIQKECLGLSEIEDGLTQKVMGAISEIMNSHSKGLKRIENMLLTGQWEGSAK